MAGRIGDGTAAGLVEYLDVLVDKGRATDGAIRPLKTAFVKVMKQVDGDGWQQIKVDSIDVADHVSRFSVLTRGTYTPKSIAVYRARMQRVVDWYNRFMSPDEAGYMPQIDTRAPRVSRMASSAEGGPSADQGQVISTPQDDTEDTTAPAVRQQSPAQHIMPTRTATVPAFTPPISDAALIDYPFPMADGTIAILRLPTAVSANDAARISRFVGTLVIDD